MTDKGGGHRTLGYSVCNCISNYHSIHIALTFSDITEPFGSEYSSLRILRTF